MPLSADQKATLQLLLERGQSYAGLAELLGIEESEVADRARSALRELAGRDPDRHVAISDYLLGQADPIGRADVVRHLREDAEDHRLAAELAERLREEVPGAELPRLPGEPRPGRFRRRSTSPTAEPSDSEAAPKAGPRLSESRTRLLVGLASAGVLVVAVVLGVTGAFGGDGNEGGTATTTTSASTDGSDGSGSNEELTRVELTPPSGGNAQGEAIFGVASADQPYVDFNVSDLDPAPQDETYVIWLMLTRKQGYPLSPFAVADDGSFQDRFAIPSAILPVVARVRFVDISIAPAKELQREISRAIDQTELVLDKPGRTVLSGEIPVSEAPSSG